MEKGGGEDGGSKGRSSNRSREGGREGGREGVPRHNPFQVARVVDEHGLRVPRDEGLQCLQAAGGVWERRGREGGVRRTTIHHLHYLGRRKGQHALPSHPPTLPPSLPPSLLTGAVMSERHVLAQLVDDGMPWPLPFQVLAHVDSPENDAWQPLVQVREGVLKEGGGKGGGEGGSL